MFLHDLNFPEHLEVVRNSGLSGYELWLETPFFWYKRGDEGLLEEVRSGVSGFDWFSIHAPVLDLNPASYNCGVRDLTLKEVLWAVDLTEELGADALTLHPGKRTVGRHPEKKDHDHFADFLERVIEHASNRVSLSLENLPGYINNLCVTPQEFEEFLSSYSELEITLDVAHAVLCQDDLSVLEGFLKFQDSISHIHLSYVSNWRHHPTHLFKKEMEDIFRLFKEYGFCKPAVLEIDDTLFGPGLSKGDKVEVLKREREYLEGVNLNNFI